MAWYHKLDFRVVRAQPKIYSLYTHRLWLVLISVGGTVEKSNSDLEYCWKSMQVGYYVKVPYGHLVTKFLFVLASPSLAFSYWAPSCLLSRFKLFFFPESWYTLFWFLVFIGCCRGEEEWYLMILLRLSGVYFYGRSYFTVDIVLGLCSHFQSIAVEWLENVITQYLVYRKHGYTS